MMMVMITLVVMMRCIGNRHAYGFEQVYCVSAEAFFFSVLSYSSMWGGLDLFIGFFLINFERKDGFDKV